MMQFFENALGALGAVCERPWHDRLQILAEGHAAKLFGVTELAEVELRFAPAEAAAARDLKREIYQGSPLTFALAEAFKEAPLPLARAVINAEPRNIGPDPSVAEKLWRTQFPSTTRFHLASEFKPAHHFSLLACVRCEIRALDQHWSAHRVAVALPEGIPDESLARDLAFASVSDTELPLGEWPAPDPGKWIAMLTQALEADLASDLAAIRKRQENFLARELERIDEYFAHYEQELSARAARTRADATRMKAAERLAAAKAEHQRRRNDQVARHEIVIQPWVDALMLLAEPAWRATVRTESGRQSESGDRIFVPRSRRWHAG